MFEQQESGGIVTFITASSYLAGPGFVGMREVMRRTFDDLWIIDLGGDNLGTRRTPNVFNIQTPVAIAIGVRGKIPSPGTPAKARYVKITGATRDDKLAQLDALAGFDSLPWELCRDEWHAPLLPAGKGDFFKWPRVIDLFPYQRSGSKFGRSWPIAETAEVLRRRWRKLLEATGDARKKAFKNNQYRQIEKQYRSHVDGSLLPRIGHLPKGADLPTIRPYAFRTYDRHWAIEDIRVNDRMGEILWLLWSDRQLYLTTLASEALADGQAIIASAYVPDLHHFCGRGGKDVIPLYRDAAASEPNVTAGLLARLSAACDVEVTAEDLAAYVYALLGGQSYTRRFWNELEIAGPRVPLTRDGALFAQAARLGRRLVWLHTYAERFRGEDRGDQVPEGTAKCIAAVPDDPARYPERFEYRPASRELIVGEGRFGPVTPEVWEFEVSGLKVVQSWLGYRMRERAGKKSSPLDAIRPERWTPRMTDELLELLWVLEATLAMEPELAATLDAVVAGDCFTAADLPQPTEDDRKAPKAGSQVAEQGSLFEESDEA